MAFRFKDLMIQVVPPGGGEDDPACTLATRDEPDPQGVPCTLATMDPAQLRPCTLATMIPPTPGVRADEPGCTLATRILFGVAGGTAAAITTVTTVTTVTTLVGGAGAADLQTLKDQLRQALDTEGGLPTTVEEANDLERRLKEAIEELQDHKKTLQKGAAKKAKPKK